MLAGETHLLANDDTFHGDPDEYKLPNYFPSDRPATRKMLLPIGRYRHLLTPDHLTADLIAPAGSLAAGALHTGHAGSLLVLP